MKFFVTLAAALLFFAIFLFTYGYIVIPIMLLILTLMSYGFAMHLKESHPISPSDAEGLNKGSNVWVTGSVYRQINDTLARGNRKVDLDDLWCWYGNYSDRPHNKYKPLHLNAICEKYSKQGWNVKVTQDYLVFSHEENEADNSSNNNRA